MGLLLLRWRSKIVHIHFGETRPQPLVRPSWYKVRPKLKDKQRSAPVVDFVARQQRNNGWFVSLKKQLTMPVEKEIKKQLAIYIKEAGGPFEFDKGNRPGIAELLRQSPYKDHPSKPIENHVDYWKNKKHFKTTEEWLSRSTSSWCFRTRTQHPIKTRTRTQTT